MKRYRALIICGLILAAIIVTWWLMPESGSKVKDNLPKPAELNPMEGDQP